MSQGVGICSGCRTTRPMAALLAVRDRSSGQLRYCCRPTDQTPTYGQSSCFTRVVRSQKLDEIALATEVRLEERREPRGGRRGAFNPASYRPTSLGMEATA